MLRHAFGYSVGFIVSVMLFTPQLAHLPGLSITIGRLTALLRGMSQSPGGNAPLFRLASKVDELAKAVATASGEWQTRHFISRSKKMARRATDLGQLAPRVGRRPLGPWRPTRICRRFSRLSWVIRFVFHVSFGTSLTLQLSWDSDEQLATISFPWLAS